MVCILSAEVACRFEMTLTKYSISLGTVWELWEVQAVKTRTWGNSLLCKGK